MFTLVGSLCSQNFIFIGERSYQSTETFTLESNSDNDNIGDLNVAFGKEETNSLIIVSSKISGLTKIANKLIIYLDDGTVISCIDRKINDNVDGTAITAYYLTDAEIEKLKNSNINTIRFEVICTMCGPYNFYEGAYSASNNGSAKIEFTKVVESFFQE
jgi:superfamily II helicase